MVHYDAPAQSRESTGHESPTDAPRPAFSWGVGRAAPAGEYRCLYVWSPAGAGSGLGDECLEDLPYDRDSTDDHQHDDHDEKPAYESFTS